MSRHLNMVWAPEVEVMQEGYLTQHTLAIKRL